MDARWRKVWSDLTANKGRSVLAIVSLAVGTAAVGAMHLAGATIGPSFEQSFLASNPPSAMLGTSDFPPRLVSRVAGHAAVGQAEGRRRLVTSAVGRGGNRVNIELVAMVDFAENRIAVVEPIDGTWPPVTGTAVVELASRDELGVAVGDVLSIENPGHELIELDIVGTARDVYEVAPDLGGLARAYVSMETMTVLVGSDDLDTLYLRAAREPLDRDQALAMTAAVRDDVLSQAGVAIELSEIREPGRHRASNGVLFMVPTMQILSVLALAVAAILIVNTVTALLAQQRRHVAMMKAIGATSGQLMTQYLAYVLLLSLVAAVVAVPISLYAGRRLSLFTADLANFQLSAMAVPWTTLAIEVAIVVVVPIAAVVVTVRRACSITVQEAITERGITSTGGHDLYSLPLSRPTLLAYRNAVRNPMRLALTVASITACGAVLVGVMSTGRALDRLTDQVSGYWAYDVELAFAEPVMVDEAETIVDRDEAVVQVEGWYRSQGFRIRPDGTENENIAITAVPPGSPSLKPTLVEGRWFDTADDHPIVVNTHFADEEPDLTVGDDVVLDIEGHRRSWTIVGVSTTTLVGPVAYVPVEDLVAELGRSGQTNLLTVQLQPGADQAAVAQRLESTARQAGLAVGQVQTNAERRAFVEGLFGLVVGFLLVVGAILTAVAVIGVAGTMTLSVGEQTREIGVIRTLGASNWAVWRLFLLQGLTIAATGCLLGVVMSLPVAWLLRIAIGNSLVDDTLPTGFSWPGVGIWVGISVLIGALGATRPARVAARLTIRNTLAYE
ncbi:MAG: ABC transporter permease [Acidimicrobiales bacterium]